MEQRINICQIAKNPGILTRLIIGLLQKTCNFEIKCPFKKSSNYKINAIDMRGFAAMTPFLPKNQRKEVRVIFMEGSQSTPIFSITVFMERIEVD